MLRKTPIAYAKAIFGYFQARCRGDLDAAISYVTLLERGRRRLENDVAATVAAIAKITEISTISLRNLESILRFHAEVQNALKMGVLPPCSRIQTA
jgi:hypothetical protein